MIEPRNMYNRGQEDNLSRRSGGGKADSVERLEGNSPGHARASAQDTTGVREGGMYLRGQLGNLGEPTVSLRDEETWVMVERRDRHTDRKGGDGFLHLRLRGPHSNKQGIGGRATSEGIREGLLAVVAEHSTNGMGVSDATDTTCRTTSAASVPVRWGTEAQRTHCREGEAGHNVLLGERWEILRDHKPYQPNYSRLRSRRRRIQGWSSPRWYT